MSPTNPHRDDPVWCATFGAYFAAAIQQRTRDGHDFAATDFTSFAEDAAAVADAAVESAPTTEAGVQWIERQLARVTAERNADADLDHPYRDGLIDGLTLALDAVRPAPPTTPAPRED